MKYIIFSFIFLIISCSKKISYDSRYGEIDGTLSTFNIEKTLIYPKNPIQSNIISLTARNYKNQPILGLVPKIRITTESNQIVDVTMNDIGNGNYQYIASLGETYLIETLNLPQLNLIDNKVGTVQVVDHPYCYQNNGMNWTNHKQSGDGSTNNPFLICTASQLKSLANTNENNDLSKNYKLMNSIDLNVFLNIQDNLFSIGSQTVGFSGVFDGNNLKILNYKPYNNKTFIHKLVGGEVKNLVFTYNYQNLLTDLPKGFLIDHIETTNNVEIKNIKAEVDFNLNSFSSNTYVGLIGKVDVLGTGQAHIQLINAKIKSTNFTNSIGGIVGIGYSPSTTNFTMDQINVQMELLSQNLDFNYIGGIVANLVNGHITNAKTNMTISGTNSYRIGGIVGISNQSTIENSFASGEIQLSGNISSFGGIVGAFNQITTVNNTISLLNITANECLSECGKVFGVQLSLDNLVSNNYTSNETIFDFNNINAQNVNEIEIDTVSNTNYFIDSTNNPYNNWDFINIWNNDYVAYPTLKDIIN